jgi:uncharacterized protein involved in propanediol utilization
MGGKMGQSVSVAGHFGELMQGRLGEGGPLALISLPCPNLYLTATALPAQWLSIHTPLGAPIVTPARARAFLAQLNLRLNAKVTLAPQMPVGAGAGASTAALVSLARLAGWRGGDLALASACVASEGASDPLMLRRPAQMLWASREGRVLALLTAPPAFDILGGFWGDGQRTNPADLHFPDISALLIGWEQAAKSQDLGALAKLATTSAQATLALRNVQSDPTAALATRLGALGYLIAHTGSARGLIFAKGTVPQNGRAALRAAGLSRALIFGYRGV